MRSGRLLIAGILLGIAGAVGWLSVRTRIRSHRQAGQPPTAQQASPQQGDLRAPAARQQEGASAASTQGGETEKQLGPFSLGGRNHFVVLRERKVEPGPDAAGESGDTVVSMEIRDAAGTALYRRTFPYVTENDGFSDFWSVLAKPLIGTHGSGLLVSYGFDSSPSAPVPESTSWWQVFGVVDGKFRPFGAPVAVEGGLFTAASTGDFYADKGIKTAGALDEHSDLLEFRVWAVHFRLIFPVRVDWAQGRLSPVVPCGKAAANGPGEACRYKVMPEDDRPASKLTFVRFCPNPTKCEKPEKIVVKSDSKVEFLASPAIVEWSDGNAAGPSETNKDPMNDAGKIGLSPQSELWLQVRIDGKEGWINSEEDFNALGMPSEQ
jgi:hypothetical protein